MDTPEERIALFMDFENLAIGAREDLKGAKFDMKPVSDALAERGRVVVRRAYADWNLFEDARRMLAEHHVEMIEIPQRMGASRKNAADIKMAVDAIELSFERDYITTYVIATGDSDFTPLVHKLRELNRRVVGIGLRGSTSAMLPPACDEFLFYDSLEGVDVPQRTSSSRRRDAASTEAPPVAAEVPADSGDLERLVTQTLSGLQRSGDTVVLASSLKRALLRKDPTFSEADHGFRSFGELLRNLASRGVIDVTDSGARGDPEVAFKASGGQDEHAFALLRQVVAKGKGPVALSGIKDRIRKIEPSFSEKAYGYGGFLQFSKAAAARGVVVMEWSEETDEYLLSLPG
ncbi:MAG: PIN domain-containing protein [Actinomycetota bacterium]